MDESTRAGASDPRFTDPPFAARVTDRREAVLAALRDTGRAASADEIAASLQLHPNTARFHLQRLVRDGLAEQSAEQRRTAGRPKVLFRARADGGGRSYLVLAHMLAQTVIATGDAVQAERIGRAWGGQLLVNSGPVVAPAQPAEVAARLEAVLDSVGFAPQITVSGTGVEVNLAHCPFLEVAREHPQLICGMHQALIQGVLDGLDSGLRVNRLLPFVTRNLCTAQLGATADA